VHSLSLAEDEVAAGTQPLDLRVDDGDAVVILVRDMPHLPLGSYNPGAVSWVAVDHELRRRLRLPSQ
jgi:hypothetical protein